ncbi:MAG: ASKHA domain-containing protein [Treponema sp.]|nr:ASKHA domain-containing protein [Treponema sp.]
MPRVVFVREKKSVQVTRGVTILDAARQAGVIIESPCNAAGSCGKCMVKIPCPQHRGLVTTLTTTHAVPEDEQKEGCVLACQSIITGDIEVETRDYADENQSMRILVQGRSFEYDRRPYVRKRPKTEQGKTETEVYAGEAVIGIEKGDTSKDVYAIALDIGTTTLVAALIDVQSGEQLDVASELNPQTAYAQDVLSRIHFASKDEGLQTLFTVFIDCLNKMIEAMTSRVKISRAHIYEIVFSGNTAMLHLATKTNPYPLGQYPYTPAISGGQCMPARELGIAVSSFGFVYLPPLISAYVGADISSGILVSRLDRAEGRILFIDIGTNGEMVLAAGGKIAASSTAAGPAFEGMNISCGMRASRGAIDSFSIHGGEVSFTVIGGAEATGICGSGLLDIAAELAAAGVIAPNGRFVQPENGAYAPELKDRMRDRDEKKAFFITRDVFLAQKDIRQIQLAKSAIRTGIELLLAHFNLSPRDITAVEIAGSFGYHLKEQSLLAIGLLPEEFAGRIYFSGNTSLSGAAAFLLNSDFMDSMRNLVKRIDTVELAGHENFDRIFVRHMAF